MEKTSPRRDARRENQKHAAGQRFFLVTRADALFAAITPSNGHAKSDENPSSIWRRCGTGSAAAPVFGAS
jgi:hypothetical protein